MPKAKGRPKAKVKLVRIDVCLTPEIAEKLRAVAEQRSHPMSLVARDILTGYLT